MKFVLSLVLGLLAVASLQTAASEETRPAMAFPADGVWKQSFDTTVGKAGKANAELRAAQFVYSMLEEQGAGPDRVQVAIVVHGSATFDFLTNARYRAHYDGIDNPNVELVDAFLTKGGEIWVSGFGLEFRKIEPSDLLPGVGIAPAGLIAHAELNRRGFMLNPFHTD